MKEKAKDMMLGILLIILGWGLGITQGFISHERSDVQRIVDNAHKHGQFYNSEQCGRCHK